MLDFDVQKFTRVCAQSERALQPGEAFFSYLMRQGGGTIRKDVAADAWDGPPEDCLAWWKAEVPDPKSKHMRWAPHDVMLHVFAATEGESGQQDVRYILALLLLRRRIFRLEATEADEAGQETMILYCSRNETEYEVTVVELAGDRTQAVQQQLAELLLDDAGESR